MVETLFLLPILIALSTFFSKKIMRTSLVVVCVTIMAIIAVQYYIHDELIAFLLNGFVHGIISFIDTAVIVYFLLQGVKHQHKPTLLLALVQLVLYGMVLLKSSPLSLGAADIIVDELASTMFIIINVIGGLIVLFALEYIKHEPCSERKKSYFMGLLLFFLGVMNLLVASNSLELLFLCFELTTLCSYLLIRFRADESSLKNALRALWMNQLGGVAILLALIISVYYYNTLHLTQLFDRLDPTMLLPIVFLIAAAYVKAASLPFQSWLLGAMIAPTPVSALLHSATMVKIAPFLILKLSVVLTPNLSVMVALFGAFVFASAAAMALSKTVFKEILGLSTIAILALIMALAAVGTPEARNAALLLMVFHSIAKALLFLQAGILEKMYSIKNIEAFDGLINYAPKVLFFILLGFASLTLPPFAAFMGKFIAIETLSGFVMSEPTYLFVLILLLIGSVFLTLLYFKIASKIFTKTVFDPRVQKPLAFLYALPSWLLTLMLFGSVGLVLDIQSVTPTELLIPLGLIVMIPFLFYMFKFKKATYVKEYNCGEKDDFIVGCYSYALPSYVHLMLSVTAVVLIVLSFVFGVLP